MSSSSYVAELHPTVYVGGNSINERSREYKVSKAIFNKAVKEGIISPLTKEEMSSHTKPRAIPKTPHFGLRYPKSEGKGRAMDTQNDMTPVQKAKFLEILTSLPIGKHFAMKQVGITPAIYRKAIARDQAFRDEIERLDGDIDDQLENVMWEEAVTGETRGSVSAAALLSKLRSERQSKSHAKRVDIQKLKIEREKLDIQRKAYDGIKTAVQEKLNWNALTFDQVNRYGLLRNKIDTREELTADEHVEYSKLTILLTYYPDDVQAEGIKALNGVTQQFSDDDEEE